MAGASNIEWTEHTWNPIVGCSVLSPGCTNCYAMRMAARIEKMKSSHYDGTTKKVNGNAVWTGKLALAPDHILLEPLRRKKPTTYFVNSMGDLFYETFPDEWIDRVFAVMALSPQHTFQVLTKRAFRMRGYFDELRDTTTRDSRIGRLVRALSDDDDICLKIKWPLANLWLGVSAERQKEADERIPHLLQTPAAIRFVSAEPLLGAIDLTAFMWPVCGWWRGPHNSYAEAKAAGAECGLKRQSLVHADARFLDWVIVGGESGPNARPMHPDWARSLRDQCEAAGVAFFFKQWGAWRPLHKGEPETWDGHQARRARDSITMHDGTYLELLGKKAAGRLLDSKHHNDMPGRA